MSKNYFHAIATLIGTIIGVGIFTVPYVINKAGILPLFLYILILGFIQYISHLHFAEVVLSVKSNHRMPGYAEKFYGQKAKFFVFITAVVGLHGTILAYIITGGTFLHNLINHLTGTNLSPSIFIASTVFFMAGSLIVFAGIKIIASMEMALSALLIFIVALITWRSANYINFDNYILVDWGNFFLPYGPVFFAIGGTVAIPAVCELLSKEKEKIRSAIFWGTSIAIFMILVFALVVVGVTGNSTSPDSLAGLSGVFKNGIMTFALALGLISISASFLIVTQTLREIYWLDLKLNKNLAWLLACSTPYLLFLVGLHNLTKVVGLTGAIMGGLLNITLIILVFGAKKKKEQKPAISNYISIPLAFGLSLIFILGLIYEVWQIFK